MLLFLYNHYNQIMTKKRPLNLSDPDLLQRKIDELRKAKGIRVTKANYMPSYGGTENKYECID